MEVIPCEVYSRASNVAVIKPPGRAFPGSVIQGDSLSILVSAARVIARAVAAGNAHGDEFRGAVELLNNQLVGRLLHYQDVLAEHGIQLPYSWRASEDDLIDLTG